MSPCDKCSQSLTCRHVDYIVRIENLMPPITSASDLYSASAYDNQHHCSTRDGMPGDAGVPTHGQHTLDLGEADEFL